MPQDPSPTPTTNESPESVGRATGASYTAARAGCYRLPRALNRRAISDGKTSLSEWISSVKSYAMLRFMHGIVCALCQLIDSAFRPDAARASASAPTARPCAERYPGNRPLLCQLAISGLNRSPRAARSSDHSRTTTLSRCGRAAIRGGSERPRAGGTDPRTARNTNPRRRQVQAPSLRRVEVERERRAPSASLRRWARGTAERDRHAPAWSAPGALTSCAAQVAIACSSLSAKRGSSDDAAPPASFCAAVRS